MTAIITDDGKTVSDTKDILEEQKKYCESLYKESDENYIRNAFVSNSDI